MKRYIFTILLALCSTQIWAEGQIEGLQLAVAPIHQNDMESIKRGAKFLQHTELSYATYLRYDKVKEAGIATNNRLSVLMV